MPLIAAQSCPELAITATGVPAVIVPCAKTVLLFGATRQITGLGAPVGGMVVATGAVEAATGAAAAGWACHAAVAGYCP